MRPPPPYALTLTPRRLLLLALAIAAALALSFAAPSFITEARLAALDLRPSRGVPRLFVQIDEDAPWKCLLGDRDEVTLRRDGIGGQGRRWNFQRFPCPEAGEDLDFWLLTTRGRGAVLLAPVEAVEDWAYPWLFSKQVEKEFPPRAARKQADESFQPKTETALRQPSKPTKGTDDPAQRKRSPEKKVADNSFSCRWVQLFVNRRYAGLYLRQNLYKIPRPHPDANRPLRELLEFGEDRVLATDLLLNGDFVLFRDLVSEGIFPPPLETPSPAMATLLAMRGGNPTLLLDERITEYAVSTAPSALPLLPEQSDEPATEIFQTREVFMRLLPMPLSLTRIMAHKDAREPEATFDERARHTWHGLSEAAHAAFENLSRKDSETLLERPAFEVFRKKFFESLETHAIFHQYDAAKLAAVQERDRNSRLLLEQ